MPFDLVEIRCFEEFSQFAYRPINQLTNFKRLETCYNTSLDKDSVLNLVISYWKFAKKMTLKLDDADQWNNGPTDGPTN